MENLPVLAITLSMSVVVMFGLFCVNVAQGSLQINLKAPGVNLDAEVKKEVIQDFDSDEADNGLPDH